MQIMDLARLQALEKINPTPLALWRTLVFTEINIEPDREKAKEKASARQKATAIAVFSNTSGQQNHLGAAVVALDPGGDIIQSQQISISLIEYWSVYAAELMAIYYAISLVYQISRKK